MCLGPTSSNLGLTPEMKEQADRESSLMLEYLKSSGGSSLLGFGRLKKEVAAQDRQDMAISDSGGNFGLKIRATPVSVQSFKNPLALKGD